MYSSHVFGLRKVTKPPGNPQAVLVMDIYTPLIEEISNCELTVFYFWYIGI